MSDNIRAGAVAIHRWFEEGENWAIHPFFGQHMRELVHALTDELNGKPGSFNRPALGGRLIGEQIPDPECPDLKARSRGPTLTRVVYLTNDVPETVWPALLQSMRQLPIPTRPGPYDELRVDVPIIKTVPCVPSPPLGSLPAHPAPPVTPHKVLATFLSSLILGIVIVAVGIVLSKRSAPNSASSPTELPRTELTVPTVTVEPPSLAELRPRLAVLSKPAVAQALGRWGEIDPPHPAVRFLKYLHSLNLPNEPLGEEQVVELAERLAGRSMSSSRQAAQVVEQFTSYELWRAKPANASLTTCRVILPVSMRRYLDAFRKPPIGMVLTADELAQWLARMGVTNLPNSVYARIDRYFAEMVRPSDFPQHWWERDDPRLWFLARLPTEPLGMDRLWESESELTAVLQELCERHLGGTGATPEAIAEQLNFSRWRASVLRPFGPMTDELSPATRAALQRLSGS